MGFEEPNATVRLQFEGEYEGAEVVCKRRVPLSIYFSIARASEKREAASVEDALQLFGDKVLVSWNMEAGGEPIPANGNGMTEISPEFMQSLLVNWLKEAAGVPAPLASSSTAGASFPDMAIPMTSLANGSQES